MPAGFAGLTAIIVIGAILRERGRMVIEIPELFTPAEVAEMRSVLEHADWSMGARLPVTVPPG